MSDHPSSKRQSNAVITDATCHNVVETRPWADLPQELLSKVADGLAMIELLGFRGTCKNWRTAAASTASAEIESSRPRKPWFLSYMEGNPNCRLFNITGKLKNYSLHLPEVANSTCLASSHGWLLLSYQGWHTFFFCPFSRATIDLPNFPHSWDVSGHVAAFSAPPTSKDCVVCVINRKNELKMELNVLERGKGKWKKVIYVCPEDMLDEVTGAGFIGGSCFYFLDKDGTLLTYSPKKKKKESLELYSLRTSADSNAPPSNVPPRTGAMPSFYYESYLMGSRALRKRLRVGEAVSISTCGTYYRNTIVNKENIEAASKEGQTWKLKGIWIHPRFHEVAPKQRW